MSAFCATVDTKIDKLQKVKEITIIEKDVWICSMMQTHVSNKITALITSVGKATLML